VVEQKKLAGESIQTEKKFRALVVGKENCVPESVHDSAGPSKTTLPSGSGSGKPGVGPLQQFSTLSRCTFNFYQS